MSAEAEESLINEKFRCFKYNEKTFITNGEMGNEEWAAAKKIIIEWADWAANNYGKDEVYDKKYCWFVTPNAGLHTTSNSYNAGYNSITPADTKPHVSLAAVESIEHRSFNNRYFAIGRTCHLPLVKKEGEICFANDENFIWLPPKPLSRANSRAVEECYLMQGAELQVVEVSYDPVRNYKKNRINQHQSAVSSSKKPAANIEKQLFKKKLFYTSATDSQRQAIAKLPGMQGTKRGQSSEKSEVSIGK